MPIQILFYICPIVNKTSTNPSMKKLFLIALLIVSYVGAFAQSKEIYILLNNPANSAGSATTPDTTRAATAYYFESPKLNNIKSVTIQCYTKKDSGTVAGNAFIEASMDPATPGSSKVWNTLVTAVGDSLAIGNGDAARFWQYNSTTTVKPDFLFWRAKVNITAISRSRVKCYLKAIQN